MAARKKPKATWSIERTKKFKATMAKKRANKNKDQPEAITSDNTQVIDGAIEELEKAQAEIMSSIERGDIKLPDEAHMHALIALRKLQGK